MNLFGFQSGIVSNLASGLISALISAGKGMRQLVYISGVLAGLAIISLLIGKNFPNYSKLFETISAVFGVIAAFLILGISLYQQAISTSEQQKIILRVEERVREHPKETQAAWELARIKLESYLTRNLSQIRWIFFLCLLVMTTGFVIIGYGITQVYKSPQNFNPSIVVTISGVIVEFIAASFLLIYKSTMEQARDYVNILERESML